MDRLSIILTLLTGAVLTGAVITTFFTLGVYNWTAVGTAVAVGWGLSWPAAYLVSRYVKRNDPHFDHTKSSKGTMREV
jgi:hypothetical protein